MTEEKTDPPETTPTKEEKETKPEETKPEKTDEPTKSGDLLGKDEEKEPEFEPISKEDVSLPEGFEPDDEAVEKFVELVNEHKISKDTREALVGLQADLMQKATESLAQAWDNTLEEWRQEAQKHPDFGGAKLDENIASVKEMINEVAGGEAEEVLEAMSVTGAGNHPAIIGLLVKLASERAEGKPTPGSPATEPQSLAERMFPNQGRG